MNRRFALLQAAISLVSLVAVVWWAVHQGSPQLPESFSAVALVVLAVAIYGVATLVRAERWQFIMRRSEITPRRADTYPLTTIGYMGNNVLPARAGELLRMFLLSPRVRASKRNVLGTIMAERVLDLFALALIFVVLAYTLLGKVNLPTSGTLAIVLAIVGVVAAAAAAGVYFWRNHSVVQRGREFATPLLAATRQLASFYGLALLALSVVIWALEGGVYLAIASALNLHFDPLDALYVVAFTNLFALIPAAPGYVGTFDAAVVFASKAIGVAGSAVVSYLILLRFALFVPITVVGLVFMVTRYGGWSRLRSARVEATSG